MIAVRYTLCALCFFSLMICPPWVPLLLMGILALLFRSWEIIIFGALADFLWLSGGVAGGVPFFTLAGLILAWGLEPLRNELFTLTN